MSGTLQSPSLTITPNTLRLMDDKLTQSNAKLRAELTYKQHYLIGYINTNNISNEPSKTNQ